MKSKTLRKVISLAASSVAIAHVLWPSLAIDAVVLSALLIAIIPWLQPLFKSVELPGGLKVEFREVVQVTEKAEAAGLVDSSISASRTEYLFQAVVDTDVNLALAGLRIELERHLLELAQLHGYEHHSRGIQSLLRHLESHQLLTNGESSAVYDILWMLNSAVHGARFEKQAADKAIDLGKGVLNTLKARIERSP